MIDRINGRLALLLAIAAVLLIVLTGWYALVSPQRSKAATLDGQIGDAQLKLATTQAFLRSPAAHRSVAELRRLQVAIPDDVRMSEILRQLSSAAGKSGVRIDSITPSAPVPTAGAEAVPISLAVTGHYFRIAKFMHLLQSEADASGGKVHAAGRLYSIDNVSLSGGGKGALLSASLMLNAFVYGSAPAAQPATAAGTATSTDPFAAPTTTETTTTTGP